jgi:leucyl-tRNA synthetase
MVKRNQYGSANSWGEYRPQAFESKWQRNWEDQKLNHAEPLSSKQKYYCLDFFPYPSGEGLHVGHCRNYVPTDLISRFKRLQGYNVLHPMGWDAFGEPTEQFSVSHGIHPRESTDQNTANFRRQMKMIGTSYDWDREIDSSNEEFYRWTQWFFLLLYKRGLAYRDTNWQWWCPTCQTTLSSHKAAGGVCWRGHTGITKREIPAWYFKITAYADQLLDGLDEIDWPKKITTMQRNWIGRSEGYEIDFEIETFRGEAGQKIKVFTTRPDTICGATFIVLAPEHSQVDAITQADQRGMVEAYRESSSSQSEVERMVESREKTGVFTGGYAINPISGERLPVWVADYVLPGYGTGAMMGVPAHDQRDFDFAKSHNIEVRQVIASSPSPDGEGNHLEKAYVDEGYLINSASFDGLTTKNAIQEIGNYLEQKGLGRQVIQYRMHDWLISRQRYWGAPIPIVYCPFCGTQPVPEDQLPVRLPKMKDFIPDGSGRSPLARVDEFVHTTCPVCGEPARRETDTMGGFACSSWYYLRFCSPDYHDGPFEPDAIRYWMPVDLYVGGAEHAVLHLLYARFWTKVMADDGLVPFHEPFNKLLSQGQMMGLDGQRMSKSRGNVVTPDEVVKAYGADALRIYVLFMAPFDQDVDWSNEGIIGSWRFLSRVWNLYDETYFGSQRSVEVDAELNKRLQKTIRGVTERIQSLRFNTMVSSLMEFINFLTDRQIQDRWRTATFHHALDLFLVLLAPTAPHISEELWHRTKHRGSIHQQTWPVWDPEFAQDESIQIAVQVNGRLRGVIDIAADAEREDVIVAACTQEKVRQYIMDKEIRNTIYVPGKIVNILTVE